MQRLKLCGILPQDLVSAQEATPFFFLLTYRKKDLYKALCNLTYGIHFPPLKNLEGNILFDLRWTSKDENNYCNPETTEGGQRKTNKK